MLTNTISNTMANFRLIILMIWVVIIAGVGIYISNRDSIIIQANRKTLKHIQSRIDSINYKLKQPL